MKEMKMRLKNGTTKVLTLSYDDAHVHDIRMMDILDKYGLKCTFNISSGRYVEEDCEREQFSGPMKLSEAKKAYTNSGHEIAVHSLNHPHINILSELDVLREVVEDKRQIENDYGIIARGMAYPFGVFNDKVKDILRKCKIAYSRTTAVTRHFWFPDDWLEWNPTCHHDDENLMELIKEFVEVPERWGLARLFCMYGHSWEFQNHNNWEKLEEFAKYAGGRDDIWYATLIEVYDYVKAYENLNISYDKKTFHNPSAISVWFELEEKEYCIKPGETLHI